MNVRHGMFRLWIVFSALFVLGISVVSFNTIREEFEISHSGNHDGIADKLGGELLLPVTCDIARGSAMTDYSSNDDGFCWYSLPKFRRLYPEYNDINNHDLSESLYRKAGMLLKHPKPWIRLMQVAGLAFGAPLAALGCSIAWALSGFHAEKPSVEG